MKTEDVEDLELYTKECKPFLSYFYHASNCKRFFNLFRAISDWCIKVYVSYQREIIFLEKIFTYNKQKSIVKAVLKEQKKEQKRKIREMIRNSNFKKNFIRFNCFNTYYDTDSEGYRRRERMSIITNRNIPHDHQIELMGEVVEAAKCVRHWHDSGKDGMVVSKKHVFKLWEALNNLEANK